MPKELLVYSETHRRNAILFPIDDLLIPIPMGNEEIVAIHYEKSLPIEVLDCLELSGEVIVGAYEVYGNKGKRHHEKELLEALNLARGKAIKLAKMK